MKVFLSWSGPVSKQVALAMRDWLPNVIQAIEPWLSTEDIGKGSRWSSEIAQQLKTTKAGIICVTPDNQNAPWLNFEAGALSKTVDKEMVCPYLFKLKPENLTGPLTQFQAAESSKEDTKKLIHTLNKGTDRPLPEGKLSESFDKWWEEFNSKLSSIVETVPGDGATRSESDMIVELLALGRDQSRSIQSVWSIVTELQRRSSARAILTGRPVDVWAPSGDQIADYDFSYPTDVSQLPIPSALISEDHPISAEGDSEDEPDPEKPVVPE